MSVDIMADFTFMSRYPCYLKEQGRREVWEETVNRSRDMHKSKYPQLSLEIDDIFDNYVLTKRVLGSQRTLRYAGPAMFQHNARGYNCAATYADRPAFFKEMLYLLLCGTGVGFSVQHHHIKSMPKLYTGDKTGIFTHQIEDTIEGWCDALDVLINSYLEYDDNPYKEYNNSIINFDYSKIRPKGSSFSHGCGIAPGYEPIQISLNNISNFFKSLVNSGVYIMRPIHIYDIAMYAAEAVISGGIRYSATLCIFSPDDSEMLMAKTGDWHIYNPQRRMSNNSVLLLRDSTSLEDFDSVIKYTKEFGEPGFIWSDNIDTIYNPCLTADTRLATFEGLITLGELYKRGDNNFVVADNRIISDGLLGTKKEYGTSIKSATKVSLTQKNAPIYELITEHGYKIKATANHRFPTEDGTKRLDELNVGDNLLLQSGDGGFGTFGTFEQGLILGMIVSDGTYNKNTKDVYIDVYHEDVNNESLDYIQSIVRSELATIPAYDGVTYHHTWNTAGGVSTKNYVKKRIGGKLLWRWVEQRLNIVNPPDIKKGVPECVWNGTRDFVRGYLQGLFWGDGSVQEGRHLNNPNKDTLTVRLSNTCYSILEGVQILLNNFGIISRVYMRQKACQQYMPNYRDGMSLYNKKTLYEIILSRPNAIGFESKIGFYGRKQALLGLKLDKRGRNCPRPERFITKVKTITFVGNEDVYCLTQPDTSSIIVNGIVTLQCLEIGLYAYTTDGDSGFQMCNLSEINGKLVQSREDFMDVARAAAILGTLQAGYTDFPYLGPVTESIVRRESLIGVGITGIMDSPTILLNPEYQREAAEIVKATNKEMAAIIGINQAARTTCVKPSGSTSLILGTASGIHPHYGRKYLKRIRANKNDRLFEYFKSYNPSMIEDNSSWISSDNDSLVVFPIEVSDDAIVWNDMDAISMLENVKLTYDNWIKFGINQELCVIPSLSHSVSNTIMLEENEWDRCVSFIYQNRQSFTGVSMLGKISEKAYFQPPYAMVYDMDDIIDKYGDLVNDILASDLINEGIKLFGGQGWKSYMFMNNGWQDNTDPSIQEWISKLILLSNKYYDGDVSRVMDCYYDMFNLYMFVTLRNSNVTVDYTRLTEINGMSLSLDPACAGGGCVI